MLSESQASMDLGGHVVRQNSSSTFCLYERSNKANFAVISVTVLPPKIGLARAEGLIDGLSNITIHGTHSYWYATPSRLLGGEKGGTISAIKNGLLVLVAIRGVASPKTAGERALSDVLHKM